MTTTEQTATIIILTIAVIFALIGIYADNNKAGATAFILFAADVGLAMILSA